MNPPRIAERFASADNAAGSCVESQEVAVKDGVHGRQHDLEAFGQSLTNRLEEQLCALRGEFFARFEENEADFKNQASELQRGLAAAEENWSAISASVELVTQRLGDFR